jgi:hypothetical protein
VERERGFELPESQTRSARSRLLFLKDWRSSVKFMVGAGIWSSASCLMDTVPSRRPVGTLQDGPPCTHTLSVSETTR